LFVSTLGEYFSGNRELFDGLFIGEKEKEWKKHPVISITLAGAKLGTIDDLMNVIDDQLGKQEEILGVTKKSDMPGLRLGNLIIRAAEKYGERTVVLVDEYDAPLLNAISDEKSLDDIRKMLMSFYAPLKELDAYLRFVFITGITKFSQLSIFSALNNIKTITMLPAFSGICGITETELETSMHTDIEHFAEANSMTCQQAKEKLQEHYDGYHFSEKSEGVYNPFSLLNAFCDKKFSDYWFATATPSFLTKSIQRFKTDITKIDGCEAFASDFDAPTENMTSVIPLFYQSGYLTIKDYNADADIYTLGYPNKEVKIGLMKSLIPFYLENNNSNIQSVAYKITNSLKEEKLDEALRYIQSYLASIPYQEGTLSDYKVTEGHFTSMLYVIFSFLGIYVSSQVRTSQGRIDILLSTDTTIFVLELKLDRPATEAMEQIENKGYMIPFSADKRNIIKAGISFSTQSRTLAEWVIS
jgi:hypothetical protein